MAICVPKSVQWRQEKCQRTDGSACPQIQEIDTSQVHQPSIIDNLKNTPDNFYGGKISDNFANWRRLTSDKWILQQVWGVQVEFQDNRSSIPHKREIVFNSTEDELLKQEISSFIKKGIIQEVEPVEDQVLSNNFLQEKKDGSQRVILNLKFLNKTIDKVHFKTDSLKHAISLIKRGCWFASVDLKDAYFSVEISAEYQKFFRFVFHGKLYEFLALPQGFRDSPRIFNKLLKPALSCLRCWHSLMILSCREIQNRTVRVQ